MKWHLAVTIAVMSRVGVYPTSWAQNRLRLCMLTIMMVLGVSITHGVRYLPSKAVRNAICAASQPPHARYCCGRRPMQYGKVRAD